MLEKPPRPAALVTNEIALAVDDPEHDKVKLVNSNVAVVMLNKLLERLKGVSIVLIVELPTILIPGAVMVIGPPVLFSIKTPAPT